MADTRNRTLLDWKMGQFDALQTDIAPYKRRGLRIKQLATLGLAAEARGFGVRTDGERLLLTEGGFTVPGGRTPSRSGEPTKRVGRGRSEESAEPPADAVVAAAPAELPVNRAARAIVDQFLD